MDLPGQREDQAKRCRQTRLCLSGIFPVILRRCPVACGKIAEESAPVGKAAAAHYLFHRQARGSQKLCRIPDAVLLYYIGRSDREQSVQSVIKSPQAEPHPVRDVRCSDVDVRFVWNEDIYFIILAPFQPTLIS